MSWRRACAAVVLTLLGSFAVIITEAEPSLAACSYKGCTGLDPHSSACDGSVKTVDYKFVKNDNYSSYSWYLRFSNTCHAFWTRLVKGDCDKIQNPDYYMRIEQQRWTPYGYYRSAVYSKKHTKGCDGTDWTRMIGWEANTQYRMCGYAHWPPTSTDLTSSIPDSAWGCWGWQDSSSES